MDNFPAGIGVIAEDEVSEFITADYTMICEDDSMINARIFPGDTVYIRQQPVESGEIAAVCINGKLTLRRVYLYPEEGITTLRAENPQYRPVTYLIEDMPVLGKAVAFTANIA